MIGPINEIYLNQVAEDWMDDAGKEKHRFDAIKEYFPLSNIILDMASGCRSFVYYGLINGYMYMG